MKRIAVEGIIGAGKTTFISFLKDRLNDFGKNTKVVNEPVERWLDGLRNIYDKNLEGLGKELAICNFQMRAFYTRKEEENKVLKNENVDILLYERTIYTDRYVFVEMLKSNIRDSLIQEYNEWWNFLNNPEFGSFTPVPEYFIYISPSVDECVRRTVVRNRVNEGEGVSDQYECQLEKTYNGFLFDPEQKNYIDPKYILEIKGNGRFEPIIDKVIDWILNPSPHSSINVN